MIIKNAKVYRTNEKVFKACDVMIQDGRFKQIGENINGENIIDCGGKYMVPGFVDIHTHGAIGIDMIWTDVDGFVEISGHYAKNGVTTIFPTTMSTEHENIIKMIETVKSARTSPELKVNFAGVHIEGPYINKNRAGAHSLDMIRNPNMAELNDMLNVTVKSGLHAHITIAPELDGAIECIKAAKKNGASITMGHTEANKQIIDEAVKNGAVSYTHLFNAMSPIHHRDAGVAGNALTGDTFVEIICDGIHLCKEVVNLAYKVKGCDKIILVSDSMSAAGLTDGEYGLESLKVVVKDGKVTVKGTDTIAGSTTNLYSELLNFMKFTGEKIENALLTVTKNPCEAVEIYDRKGSIDISKDADFVILDENYNINAVYVNGKAV